MSARRTATQMVPFFSTASKHVPTHEHPQLHYCHAFTSRFSGYRGDGEQPPALRISGGEPQRFPPSATPVSPLSATFTKNRGDPRGNFSTSGQIQQHHIRVFLHSLEHNLTPVRRNVEVANVEIGGEVGQLSLRARFQVDEPEILVLNLSSQQHQRPSAG